MLPKNLSEIRQKLERKSYTDRTSGEDELLEELQELDKILEAGGAAIRKTAGDRFFQETRIVGGPSGVCKCCGR